MWIYNTVEGLTQLRRLLLAYSIYNDAVGYCQVRGTAPSGTPTSAPGSSLLRCPSKHWGVARIVPSSPHVPGLRRCIHVETGPHLRWDVNSARKRWNRLAIPPSAPLLFGAFWARVRFRSSCSC